MKITIKDTEHAKIYYPELIGKTFENCTELEYNNFIKIFHKENDGSQCIIIKADCIILEKINIPDEIKNINHYLSKIIIDENIILNRYVPEYFCKIRESLDKLKEKYNDMLRSHE